MTAAYDPDDLVRDVQTHLQLQGIEAELQPGQKKEAGIAASMLLRALGVRPAMNDAAALSRSMDKPWSDADQ